MIVLASCFIEMSSSSYILTSLIVMSLFVWNTTVIFKISTYGVERSARVRKVYKSLLKNNNLNNKDRTLIKTYIRFLSLFKN